MCVCLKKSKGKGLLMESTSNSDTSMLILNCNIVKDLSIVPCPFPINTPLC